MLDFLKNNKNTLILAVILVILTIIIYSSSFGFSNINPLNVNWVYNYSSIDITQLHLGFKYFKSSPWAFPLGLFDTLSYPTYTSIFNTISIPLVAIPLKLLAPILPNDFQYIGLWNLFCFIAQALVGMLIIKKYTTNDIQGNIKTILASIMLVLTPYMVVFAFWQPHMICHFLILLAFIPFVYEKMTLKQTLLLYLILGFMAGAINNYIVAILGLIILAYSVMMLVKTKDYKTLFNILLYSIAAIISMYIYGAFSVNSILESNINFEWSLNLNAFFNSYNICKFLTLPSVTHTSEANIEQNVQHISFCYFGIGNILLILIAFFILIFDLINKKIKFDKTKTITLIILSIISLILALSPVVTFSNKILFKIPYPDFIINIWSIFRVTGRFALICYYIIIISSILYILKRINTKIVIAIFILAISIQLIDLTPRMDNGGKNILDSAYENNIIFKELFKNNNIKTVIVSPYAINIARITDMNYFWYPLIKQASEYKIKFNDYYFARDVENIGVYYINSIKNPKDSDLFVYDNTNDLINSYSYGKIKYFYYIDGYVIGRITEIKGMEKIEKFKPISINATNLDILFKRSLEYIKF